MSQNIRGAMSLGRPAVGALTACFLAYLFLLPPHLVHHLFEDDQGRHSCALLAQSQDTPGLQTDLPAFCTPSLTETLEALLSGTSLPSPDFAVSNPRAPPSFALSV